MIVFLSDRTRRVMKTYPLLEISPFVQVVVVPLKGPEKPPIVLWLSFKYYKGKCSPINNGEWQSFLLHFCFTEIPSIFTSTSGNHSFTVSRFSTQNLVSFLSPAWTRSLSKLCGKLWPSRSYLSASNTSDNLNEEELDYLLNLEEESDLGDITSDASDQDVSWVPESQKPRRRYSSSSSSTNYSSDGEEVDNSANRPVINTDVSCDVTFRGKMDTNGVPTLHR